MKIEIKTLEHNMEISAHEDIELAAHLNDGWEIIPSLSAVVAILKTYGDSDQFSYSVPTRFITLKRENRDDEPLSGQTHFEKVTEEFATMLTDIRAAGCILPISVLIQKWQNDEESLASVAMRIIESNIMRGYSPILTAMCEKYGEEWKKS